MQKNKGKTKRIFKLLFKAGVTCVYLALVVALVLQALKPGDQSAAISNDFGNKLDNVMTQIDTPKVENIDAQSVEITSLKFDGKTYSGQNIVVGVGASGEIKSKVLPSDATDKSLVYSSSNSNVLKVYSNGRVVAKSAGQAQVCIALKSNEQLTDVITVTVLDIPLESVQIDNIPTELRVGQKHVLETVFMPENATQTKVEWSSSNTKIILVDSSGKITAKAEGVAIITAKSAFNSDIFASVELQVLPAVEHPTVPVQSLEIKTENASHCVGKNQQLSVKFYPADATDKILWSSSDESVAKVSQNGVVKYLKEGNVVITASCSNFDKYATIVIKVDEVVSSKIVLQTDIDNQDGNFVLKQGKSGKVTAILDEDATVFDVVFASSDDKIAQIGADGVVTALKGGEVTITATTSYGDKTTTQTMVLVVDRITFGETMKNFYMWVRKGFGHFGAFLVLGIFATMTYYMLFAKTTKGKLIGFAVCLFAGFAVAGITEILQLPLFTAGRTSSFSDVMLDFKGYCYSSLAIYAIIFIIHFAKMLSKRKAKG